MFYNVGAVTGAVIFGLLSERIGRRYTMFAALAVPCHYSGMGVRQWTLMLAMGAFIMQMGVQGAWGVIPCTLTSFRPTQSVACCRDSPTRSESCLPPQLRREFACAIGGLSWALTAFELVVIACLSLVLIFGKENRGRSFLREKPVAVAG